MDWSNVAIPPMRLEARFGDRVVPAFSERPKNIWAMVEQAAARNGGGEALVCGDRRMTWREVARQSHRISADPVRGGPNGPCHGDARHAPAEA